MYINSIEMFISKQRVFHQRHSRCSRTHPRDEHILQKEERDPGTRVIQSRGSLARVPVRGPQYEGRVEVGFVHLVRHVPLGGRVPVRRLGVFDVADDESTVCLFLSKHGGDKSLWGHFRVCV